MEPARKSPEQTGRWRRTSQRKNRSTGGREWLNQSKPPANIFSPTLESQQWTGPLPNQILMSHTETSVISKSLGEVERVIPNSNEIIKTTLVPKGFIGWPHRITLFGSRLNLFGASLNLSTECSTWTQKGFYMEPKMVLLWGQPNDKEVSYGETCVTAH